MRPAVDYPSPASDEPTTAPRHLRDWWPPLLLITAVVLAYSNSFSGAFLLDDRRSIIDNPTITRLWPLSGPLSPPTSSATVSGRPVANVSFALNYAAHGLEVWGYHALNLAIHGGAALALFGLVRRTLLLPRLRERWSAHATPAAFFVAAIWALHPLQTESVTYIVQRVESLMGLCYLLTFYAFVRATSEPQQRRWAWLALAACTCGMATKEVMVSAPLLVLLFDRTFISGSFREAWRQHRPLLLGLAATWLLLGYLVVSGGGNRGGSIGFGSDVEPWDYWLTQPRAIVRYLKVAIWPHPLVFEYGPDWVQSAIEVVPYAIVVTTLGTGSLVALWRNSPLGFFGAWFFSILAPTSVMPGVSQLTVEHRMYLPLAVMVAAFVLAVYASPARGRAWALAIVATGLGILTVHRNADYRDALTLWRDTVIKRPDNPLAHDNLATALVATGKLEEALRHHAQAVAIAPGVAGFHYTYASALRLAGRTAESKRELEEAVRLAPTLAAAHNDLGAALIDEGRVDDAIAQYQIALRLESANASFVYNLGAAWLRQGLSAKAVDQFTEALRLNPNHALAHHDLGAAYAQLGRYDEARTEFETAIRLNPSDLRARTNLANVFGALNRPTEARAEFEAVLRLDPNNTAARDGLARLEAAFGPR